MSNYHFVPRRFVMAEFADSDAMLAGTTAMRVKGHKKLDTHSPYPVHGIEEALGLGRPKIPAIVLTGAVIGIISAVSLMVYTNAIDFPINIANRPNISPPSWVPVTFELAVLLGGCSSFFGVLALMGFPKPYHPVFEWDRFSEKSVDGFFLSLELEDGEDAARVADEVRGTGATAVQMIEESER